MYIRDNFFDKPDEIRALALAQEYGKWGHNNYPGYRSKMICEIDMDLWDELSLRLMQFPVCSQMGLNVMKAEFAYVPGRFGKGWPHIDEDATLAGAIYLSPDAPATSGTSFYEPIPGRFPKKYNRSKFFMNPEKHYDEAMEANDNVRNCYRKYHAVDNVYNRMAMWYSNVYHSEQSFFGDKLDDSRLTLLYFLHRI